MTATRQHFVFAALCLVAPSALLVFGITYLSHQGFAVGCSVVGLFAAITLFFWSLFTFRRHTIRAVIGIVVCLVVFWLLLVIPGYIEAKRRGLHAAWPNQTLEAKRRAHAGCNRTPQPPLASAWR